VQTQKMDLPVIFFQGPPPELRIASLYCVVLKGARVQRSGAGCYLRLTVYYVSGPFRMQN
jgi:hypothetical protein